MAAVLAGGEGAALSHRSAAELWDLLRPQRGPIHVSIRARSGRAKRDGLQLHRCSSLVAGTTTRRLNIPVTTATWTFADSGSKLADSTNGRSTRNRIEWRRT